MLWWCDHLDCRHDRFSTALEQTAQGRALALMLSDQVIMVGKLQAAAKEATKNRRQNINTKVRLGHMQWQLLAVTTDVTTDAFAWFPLRLGLSSQIANLNHLLSEKGSFSSLLHMDPLVLPVNPSIRVTGVVPGSSRVFRSAMYPVMVSFYKAPEDTSTGSVRAPCVEPLCCARLDAALVWPGRTQGQFRWRW